MSDRPGQSAADRSRAELVRVAGGPEDAVWLTAGAEGVGLVEGAAVVVLDGVLEQVAEPAAFLRELGDAGVLAEDGRLVVGVRNAGHAGVLAELMTGRAVAGGLLDRAQRSWFTFETLRDLLESSGLSVVEVHRVRYPVAAASAAAVTGGSGDVESYVVVARPSDPAGRVAELSARLAAADAEAVEAARRLADVTALLGEERAEHARLLEAGRRDLVALRAENAQLTARLADRDRELTEARSSSAQLQASPEYLAGERVLHATSTLRGAGGRVRSALKRPR